MTKTPSKANDPQKKSVQKKASPPKSTAEASKPSASTKGTNVASDAPGSSGDFLTTNQGVKISDNHNSLKVGPRGPTLLEDFVLREKITHFDHERIPERVVHARGAGAFGYFECTKDMSEYTNAGFLTEIGKKTKVLTRFSTVAGSRGSMDTARDVRGFATKFYTDEGNYDLVGNNIPVFFIHDSMKFPDLIHAVKPAQDTEIPQAQSAHDTFWDFISLMPESTHMVFWVMSDRAIPRSFRMMEGFGVHTFRFVNEEGKGTFVKFHWKPRLGTHALTWEEAMTLGGHDPDFHRRDLYESIQAGAFPEWDLGVQLIPEEDEFTFDFDLLDATKVVPEEIVPVEIIGRLVLNRVPDNFFAEIEQVAFHPGNMVPGIDVTNDPLLQGRLFSYIDTQLTRLGGPNFHEIPVNRPLAPVNNNQRDGFGRQHIPQGPVAYEPNSLGGGCPFHSPEKLKTYVHYTERVDAHKVRARSTSFSDHYGQAKLFFNSLKPVEQEHLKNAFAFELSKVQTIAVRERMLGNLSRVNLNLAQQISEKIGVDVPKDFRTPPNPAEPDNNIIPENRSMTVALEDDVKVKPGNSKTVEVSPALSMIKDEPGNIETRKIALLIGEKNVDASQINQIKTIIANEGAIVEVIAPRLGIFDGVKADKSLDIATSFQYDALILPGGATAQGLTNNGLALRFVAQIYKQCKAIAVIDDAEAVFEKALQDKMVTHDYPGVAIGKNVTKTIEEFISIAKNHRVWDRESEVVNMPA